MEISKLYATIDASLAPLKSGLTRAKALIGKAAASFREKMSGDMLKGAVSGIFTGIGFGAFNAAVQAASATVQGIGYLISDASARGSDLNETISKTQVLLGQNAEGALKFAKELQNAGQGQMTDILESLSGSTLAMKQMGVETQKAIDLAKKLESRVGDIASQDNIDPKELRENIQSAFSGEYQVLRKYKVFIDAESLKKSGKVTAEAMAEEFLRQTERAAGDFDRTKMSSANLGRTAMNTFQSALTELGQQMYPAVQAFQYLKTTLADLFYSMVNSGAFTAVIDTFRNAFESLSASVQVKGEALSSTIVWMAEVIAEGVSAFADVFSSFSSAREFLVYGVRSVAQTLLEASAAILRFVKYIPGFSGAALAAEALGIDPKTLAEANQKWLDGAMDKMVERNLESMSKRDEIAKKLRDSREAVTQPANMPDKPPALALTKEPKLGRVDLGKLLDDAQSAKTDKQINLLQKIAENTAKPGQPGAADVSQKSARDKAVRAAAVGGGWMTALLSQGA